MRQIMNLSMVFFENGVLKYYELVEEVIYIFMGVLEKKLVKTLDGACLLVGCHC